jgi:hypothetical protein
MYSQRCRGTLRRDLCLIASFSALLVCSSAAQSLDPDKPAPMKAGPNRGTVDNFVGPIISIFGRAQGMSRSMQHSSP